MDNAPELSKRPPSGDELQAATIRFIEGAADVSDHTIFERANGSAGTIGKYLLCMAGGEQVFCGSPAVLEDGSVAVLSRDSPEPVILEGKFDIMDVQQ